MVKTRKAPRTPEGKGGKCFQLFPLNFEQKHGFLSFAWLSIKPNSFVISWNFACEPKFFKGILKGVMTWAKVTSLVCRL